ncbi:fungal specific transcription factor [Paraphaeosphaeria sporulosa]
MDDRPPAAKVAVPRLPRYDHDSRSPQNERSGHRVQKACNNCRKRKVRCTGEQPHCQKCVDQHMSCLYLQTRRDRLKEFVCRTPRIASLIPGRANSDIYHFEYSSLRKSTSILSLIQA